MMAVVTTAKLRSGAEAQWDSAMRQRFGSARNRPGWISGQLVTPDDDSSTRMIVATRRTRTDWKNWHHDPAFLEQRGTLERLDEEPSRSEWFRVVADARASG
jgi:heme-degrading monooxygenase HmoA